MDFDIDMSRSPGVRSIDPPLPVDYSPRASVRQHLIVMCVVLAMVLLIPLWFAAIMLAERWLAGALADKAL